ncbi:MAG: aldehyde dehydrogenase [Acidobacteria bacterium]|nr:aldehyde dehydrogenase [Acidobacteriota bacterium]
MNSADTLNYIEGTLRPSRSGETFEKISPVNGQVLSRVARSNADDVRDAVAVARRAFPGWAALPGVQRGQTLHRLVRVMQDRQAETAAIVAAESGKSAKDAAGEAAGAAALGLFFAGEGQRLYGRTTTSSVANRRAMTIRQPIGVAGLIVPANTPIANVAWKAFPALVCGNAVVLKSAEDTPGTAALFAEMSHQAGLPEGVFNVVHGLGREAGAALVEHPDVGVISFTGSTAVGREIQRVAGVRLARVSLELGGKNPFVVCDDADLDEAVRWAVLSAFSNAGQRCASGSRIIVFASVADEFRSRLVEATLKLRVGSADQDDFGPVINQRQMDAILHGVDEARQSGARILTGGRRAKSGQLAHGFYIEPTLVDTLAADHPVSHQELFGPVATLYTVSGFAEALAMANDSPYGLTACIHTRNLDRALAFVERVEAGVAIVNGGTFGSEPHMPFGGVKQSGNGTREPGTEALDVYSSLKDVYLNLDDRRL